MDVSRSGYNAWKKRVPSDTSIRRTVLKEKIQKIYDDSHQNYGAPKIAAELRKSGETITEKTVGNYMRQMGIKAQWIKPYTQTTIDSDLSQKLKNILNEKFNPEHPDAVWCSDITYIWTYEGFVYLTSIMDLYSRKIISWVLSETLEASHVVKCIEKAKQSRHIENPLIFIVTEDVNMYQKHFTRQHGRNDSQLFQEGLSLGQCLHRIVPCPFKTRVD
ncbi:MAG: IS3 family transposase [Coprococcus phoceensis]